MGKTVACAWAMVHTTARYWKPVQAGLDQTDENIIRALTGAGEERFIETTYALPEPLSPHEAARRAGVHIEMTSFRLPDDDDPL
ncbi:MAG: AAA family ATPase, partial [Methyloligellaceae bacterium]